MWGSRLITIALSGALAVACSPSIAQTRPRSLPPSTLQGNSTSQLVANDLDTPPPTVIPRSDNGSLIEDRGLSFERDPWDGQVWEWQTLPEGLIYRSYLAGVKEPRIGCQWIHERDHPFWDVSLGGRAGIVRYGSTDPLWPEGYQLDIEGAAFPRLTLDEARDLVSVDFRFGIPLTFRYGPWEAKFGYYHLSSHLGDEYMLSHPWLHRINYSRDNLILGVGLRPCTDIRFYGETAWAFYSDGGTEPWEFQFGVEYSPARPASFRGAPFFAVGAHLHQEDNFGGEMVAQAGWEWRSATGRVFRCGLHYLNGKSNQYQFFNEHEEQIGFGTWFDF